MINVSIGSSDHPMFDARSIPWGYVEAENSGQRKHFNPSDEPGAAFSISADKAVTAPSCRNLRSLRKTKV